MSFLAHPVVFTSGGDTGDSRRYDQCFRPSSTSIVRSSIVASGSSRGSGAPMSIQVSKSAITSSGSLPAGGISKPSYWSAASRRLSSLLPGTTAAPLSPPLAIPPRESTSRLAFSLPARRASAEWHW